MSLPSDLQTTLDRVRDAVAADPRFVGLAVGGSLLTGDVDAYSDLDLVVVVSEAAHADVMDDRVAIAAGWGSLVAAFTGEHVGEPRLLICLYDDPLVHVDLKFVTADELAVRIEDPVVLWERGDEVSAAIAQSAPLAPVADPQWIEDRFWVWVHYGAAKLGRGELFEVLELLAFLRAAALAALLSSVEDTPVRGVRRLEQRYPDRVTALSGTTAVYDRDSCVDALRACVQAYRALRDLVATPVVRRDDAERLAIAYLAEVAGDR